MIKIKQTRWWTEEVHSFETLEDAAKWANPTGFSVDTAADWLEAVKESLEEGEETPVAEGEYYWSCYGNDDNGWAASEEEAAMS